MTFEGPQKLAVYMGFCPTPINTIQVCVCMFCDVVSLMVCHCVSLMVCHCVTNGVSLCVKVHLPNWVQAIEDRLAENIHDVWAVSKIKGGWKYNEVSSQHSVRYNWYLA